MKKLAVLLIIITLCFGLAVFAAAANSVFSDVPSGHWAYDAITDMASRGIVQGVGNGLFDPDSPVSPAEFCTMLTRLFYADELNARQGQAGFWWQANADVALQAGLLDGTVAFSHYQSGQWDQTVMESPLSRYDMAQIMTNVLTAQGVALPSESDMQAASEQIADFDTVPEAYADAVTAMYALGCLQGNDAAGHFAGDASMDRAAACTVLVRLVDAVETSSTQVDLQSLRQEMLELVNHERAKVGLSPLTLDEKLCEAAQLRAQETVENYSHTRPDGSDWSTVLSQSGISYGRAAENIYQSPATPEAAVEGWMASPGHRANILNANLHSIGIGYYYTDTGWQHYWVQLFTD